jgi:hypothetical protein
LDGSMCNRDKTRQDKTTNVKCEKCGPVE